MIVGSFQKDGHKGPQILKWLNFWFSSSVHRTTLREQQQAFNLDQESCPVSNSPIGDVVRQVERRDIQRGFSLETCSVFPDWRQVRIGEQFHTCPGSFQTGTTSFEFTCNWQLTLRLGLNTLSQFLTPQQEETHACCPKTILMIHDDDS